MTDIAKNYLFISILITISSKNVIFGANSGSRKHIPDVAIVMTDGKAQNREHVVSASKMIHDVSTHHFTYTVRG